MHLRFLAALLLLPGSGWAQSPLATRYDAERTRHDALHYDVELHLADSGTAFRATVTTRWKLTGPDAIRIELDSAYAIRALTLDAEPVRWRREGIAVVVNPPAGAKSGDTAVTKIEYEGSPPKFGATGQDDGLVQRGAGAARTIFADNWPDRARRWLASQDHPSDKATVSWSITAPAGLTVVATGTLVGVDTLPSSERRWRFDTTQPIPVYTMVVGAARLAVTALAPALCEIRCVPVSVFAYPADSAWAVTGPFSHAAEMVNFFSRLIAPFPYDELRHVETSTIFGGMENSTVIFYDEGAYTKHTLSEATVAHETAHQWFGDAVTEADWHHLWLSEGFATYGAVLWAEHQDGDSARYSAMQAHKKTVIEAPVLEQPILDPKAGRSPAVTGPRAGSKIDPRANNLLSLLNANNYSKGAWILHSLRGLIGDSAFFRGLRRYYRTYEHRNALSEDFAHVMSEAAGQDLSWYFTQALTQPGYPILEVRAAVAGGRAVLTARQVQKPAWGRYRLPNLAVRVGTRTVTLPITGPVNRVTIPWNGTERPDVVVDPSGWWLVESRTP